MNGVPVGVQIVAVQHYREDLCLLAGEAIEARGTPLSPVMPVTPLTSRLRRASEPASQWLTPAHRRRLPAVRACASVSLQVTDTLPAPDRESRRPCFFFFWAMCPADCREVGVAGGGDQRVALLSPVSSTTTCIVLTLPAARALAASGIVICHHA